MASGQHVPVVVGYTHGSNSSTFVRDWGPPPASTNGEYYILPSTRRSASTQAPLRGAKAPLPVFKPIPFLPVSLRLKPLSYTPNERTEIRGQIPIGWRMPNNPKRKIDPILSKTQSFHENATASTLHNKKVRAEYAAALDAENLVNMQIAANKAGDTFLPTLEQMREAHQDKWRRTRFAAAKSEKKRDPFDEYLSRSLYTPFSVKSGVSIPRGDQTPRKLSFAHPHRDDEQESINDDFKVTEAGPRLPSGDEDVEEVKGPTREPGESPGNYFLAAGYARVAASTRFIYSELSKHYMKRSSTNKSLASDRSRSVEQRKIFEEASEDDANRGRFMQNVAAYFDQEAKNATTTANAIWDTDGSLHIISGPEREEKVQAATHSGEMYTFWETQFKDNFETDQIIFPYSEQGADMLRSIKGELGLPEEAAGGRVFVEPHDPSFIGASFLLERSSELIPQSPSERPAVLVAASPRREFDSSRPFDDVPQLDPSESLSSGGHVMEVNIAEAEDLQESKAAGERSIFEEQGENLFEEEGIEHLTGNAFNFIVDHPWLRKTEAGFLPTDIIKRNTAIVLDDASNDPLFQPEDARSLMDFLIKRKEEHSIELPISRKTFGSTGLSLYVEALKERLEEGIAYSAGYANIVWKHLVRALQLSYSNPETRRDLYYQIAKQIPRAFVDTKTGDVKEMPQKILRIKEGTKLFLYPK